MKKLINQCREKIKNHEETLLQLTYKKHDLEEKVENTRSFMLKIVIISFLVNFFGYMVANSIIVIVSLSMLLAIAPFGFKYINLQDKQEKTEKEIEETENLLYEAQDELERLYSREEVLDLIRERNATSIKTEPILVTTNNQNQNNNNVR